MVNVSDDEVKVRRFCEPLHFIKPKQMNEHDLWKIMRRIHIYGSIKMYPGIVYHQAGSKSCVQTGKPDIDCSDMWKNISESLVVVISNMKTRIFSLTHTQKAPAP